MAPQLSSGAIQKILNGEEVPMPIFQLLSIKPSQNPPIRYRVLLSDGVVATVAIIGSQNNHFFESRQADKFAVIQAEKCTTNTNNDRKVLVILNLKVLTTGQEVGIRIGNPRNLNPLSSSGEATSTTTNSTFNNGPTQNVGNKDMSYANSTNGNAHLGSNATNGSMVNVFPISCLTPYQNRWTIRARVTTKPPIRTWSNSRGEGKLFNITLLDESGEIRATGFKEEVDKFYDLLEVNKVYYISKATLKTANRQFSSVKNEYEMTFNSETTVVPCDENVSNIPMLQFDFVPISQIEKVEKDSTIDVIGVCKSSADPQTIITRANKEIIKREIRLVDSTNTEVSLTMWGEDATKFDGTDHPVLAIKGCRVSDFSGRSLSLLNSSVFQIDPEIPEAHKLKGWYMREGCHSEAQSISTRGNQGAGNLGGDWKTFAQVRVENLGIGEKPDYFSSKATVVAVRKENCMYKSCPTPQCNKKVVDLDNGMYRCEKCNKEHPEFHWRLLLSLSIADFTENLWVTCFQESAETILGMTAQQLGTLKEQDEEQFNQAISNANFKSFIFKLRMKMETFNEESRLKTIVVSANPVDNAVLLKRLLGEVKKLSA